MLLPKDNVPPLSPAFLVTGHRTNALLPMVCPPLSVQPVSLGFVDGLISEEGRPSLAAKCFSPLVRPKQLAKKCMICVLTVGITCSILVLKGFPCILGRTTKQGDRCSKISASHPRQVAAWQGQALSIEFVHSCLPFNETPQ